MKKILIIVAALFGACVLRAESGPFPFFDCNVGYESEHMNRGRPEMRKSIFAEIELGFSLTDALTTYAGVAQVVAINSNSRNDGRDEVKPYVGLCYDVTDVIKVDVGYAHHFYTSERDNVIGGGAPGLVALSSVGDLTDENKYKSSGEIYGGISADVLLSPSLYCFYDFTKEEVAIEGNVSHKFDLSDFFLNDWALKISGKIGYDRPGKIFGLKKPISDFLDANLDPFSAKGYAYYGVGADLVYSLNDKVEASVGVSCEGNTAAKNDASNAYTNGKRRSAIVFRGGVSCSF